LLAGGVVQIASSVNPAVVGCSMLTLVAIKVSGSARQIAREVASLPSVDFVVCTAGSFDIPCRDCPDAAELLTIHSHNGLTRSPVRWPLGV
jgi:Lrp/AsnC family transcriptional regulator, regulator for asnA, asnC and gidA